MERLESHQRRLPLPPRNRQHILLYPTKLGLILTPIKLKFCSQNKPSLERNPDRSVITLIRITDSSWGTASGLASSANPFPGLPAPGAAKGKASTSSWVPQASASSSAPSSTPSSRPASTGPSKPIARGNDAFPALPPAAKPQSTIFGYGSGMVRRDAGRGASASAWSSAAAPAEVDSEAVDEGAGRGKKKGNKGKKQVLNLWA